MPDKTKLDLDWKGSYDPDEMTETHEVNLNLEKEAAWSVRVWAKHKTSILTGAGGVVAVGAALTWYFN